MKLRTSIFNNHSDLKIKGDPVQHLHFLQCFLPHSKLAEVTACLIRHGLCWVYLIYPFIFRNSFAFQQVQNTLKNIVSIISRNTFVIYRAELQNVTDMMGKEILAESTTVMIYDLYGLG